MSRMAFLAVLLCASPLFANPVSTYWLNNRGAKLLSEDRAFEAGQSLVEGLADSPFQPELHLNLGLSFERQKESDKALSEYKTAFAMAQNPQLKFAAAFNAGRVLGELKRIPEALAAYQQALEFDPQSKETKTNIELLLANGGGSGQGEQNQKQNKDQGDGKKDPKDDQKKDGQPKDQPRDPPKDPKDQRKGQQPREFQSQNMSQEDVRKILEELKNQEQQIRRKEYDKKAKEAPGGKDW